MPESKAKNALIFLLLLGVGGAGASVFVYKVIIAPKHVSRGSRSADQTGDYLAQSGAASDEDLPEELKRARRAQQAGSQYSGVNYGKSSLGLVGGNLPGKDAKDKKGTGADQEAAASAVAAGSGAGLGTGIAGGKQLAKGFVGKSSFDKAGAGNNLSNAMQQANAGANKGGTQVASGAGVAGQGAGGSAKGRMATAIHAGKMAARSASGSTRRGAVADLKARRDTFARGVSSGYGTAGGARSMDGAAGVDAPAGVAPKGVDLTMGGEQLDLTQDVNQPSALTNETPTSNNPGCNDVFCIDAKVGEGSLDASDYFGMVAIGAAAGAVIGACIGGPWGALIGGIAGAIVGALAGPLNLNETYTSHIEVTIPSDQDAQGNPKKIKSVDAPFQIENLGWGEDTSAEVLDIFAVNENAMFLVHYKFCVDSDCEEPEFLYIHSEVKNAAGQTMGRWACLPGETDRGFKCLIPANSQDIPSSMRSCRPIMETIHRECSAAGMIHDRTKYESYQVEAGEGGDLKQACMKLNDDLGAQLSNCIQGLR